MKIGMVFPNELGPDAGMVTRYAREMEAAGFSYLLAFDHVVGADTKTRPDWNQPYSSDDLFHEPLMLFSYLAGITELEFVTGIVVLPQRQAVLVAKQVAELDVLSEGRVRFGVGLGWNQLEYEALGVDFANRAARFEEQIEVLRQLWTHEIVDFAGSFHRVDRAGLLPMPVQRPIPIWMGTMGTARGALERIGRLADGWMPNRLPGAQLDEAREIVDAAAAKAGRDPSVIRLEGRIRVPHDIDGDAIRRAVDAWEQAGADYVAFDTLHVGLTPQQHLDRGLQLAEIAGVPPRSTR